MTKAKKPIAFNYSEYTRVLEEIERLKEEIERLNRQLELQEKGTTVTDIIWYVKNEMCEVCIHKDDCNIRLEEGTYYACPLNLL